MNGVPVQSVLAYKKFTSVDWNPLFVTVNASHSLFSKRATRPRSSKMPTSWFTASHYAKSTTTRRSDFQRRHVRD